MRAVLSRQYGGPDVLEPADVPTPSIADNDVLVKVVAAGTNPVDRECREGQAAPWFDDGPWIWGWDVAGVVEAVGAGVTRFAPGDDVFGMPRFPSLAGGYAEYVSAPAQDLAAKPAGSTYAQAAALPLCSLTALQVLDLTETVSGQHVLINGAAGGVGHIAVQLAKARGAHVTAIARKTNHDFLCALGADEVVDYTTTSVPDTVSDIDVVVDLVGIDALVRTVRPGGIIAPVPGAARGAGPLEEAAQERGVRVLRHVVHPDGDSLTYIARLVDQGLLNAEITDRLPLEQAAEAHRRMQAGHGRGKIVLTVQPPR
ncbi:NADP-dependent oxidoreductase [Streptomyces sp. NBC_00009]|uniref:NADP-dependent oxidoreductase n=1 Tax=Streptomyces sp. NBC_00009 TaxID=2975620 RepID=UPI00324CB757